LQGILTQELDFTTTPLDYALLERSLGPAHTMAWFPVLPPHGAPQSPYDPGPYRYRGIDPIAAQASAASVTAQPAAATAAPGPAPRGPPGLVAGPRHPAPRRAPLARQAPYCIK